MTPHPDTQLRTDDATLRVAHAPVDSLCILIVDDDAAVRSLVECVLQRAGYTTMIAADGPEALDVAARAGMVDLLLTDVVMPKMHGGELARRMRELDNDLKVLFLTGARDWLFKEKPVWAGEAFLDKPCSVDGLLEAVGLVLRGHARAKAPDRC